MVEYSLEIKKLFRSRKMIATLVLSFLISISYFSYIYIERSKASQSIIDRISEVTDIENKKMESAKAHLDAGEVTQKSYDDFLDSNKGLLDIEREIHFKLANRDFYAVPKLLVDFYDAYARYSEKSSFDRMDLPPNMSASDVDFYDDMKDLVAKGLPYEDDTYTLTGPNFIRSLSDVFLGVGLMSLLILIISDIFGGQDIVGRVNIRKNQPRPSLELFLSKSIASLVLCVTCIVSIFVFSYIICGIFGDGFGTFAYPVNRYIYEFPPPFPGKMLYRESLSLGLYIFIKAIIFILVYTMFLGLMTFCSVIFKSSLLVSILSLTSLFLTSSIYKNVFVFIEKGVSFIDCFISQAILFGLKELYKYNLIKNKLILIIPLLTGFAFIFLSNSLAKNSFVQSLFSSSNECRLFTSLDGVFSYKLIALKFELVKIIRNQWTYIAVVFILLVSVTTSLKSKFDYGKIYTKHQELTGNFLDHYITELMFDRSIFNKTNVDNYKKFYKAYLENDNSGIGEYFKYSFSIELVSALGINNTYSNETKSINIKNIDEILKRNMVMEQKLGTFPMTSPFDTYTSFERLVFKTMYGEKYQPSVSFNINKLFTRYMSLIGILIMLILIFDGFSGERGRNRTLDFMNIQGRSSFSIYTAKLVSQIGLGLLIFISSIALSYMSLFISGARGAYNYPSIHYDNKLEGTYGGHKYMRASIKENQTEKIKEIYKGKESNRNFVGVSFKNMGSDNIKLIVSSLLVIAFIVSIAGLVSLYIKNKWASSIITGLGLTFSYFISLKVLKGFSWLLPFIYLDPTRIINGRLSIVFDKDYMGFVSLIIVLSLWTILSLGLGVYLFKKRRARGL